jgi:hypothetical protein
MYHRKVSGGRARAETRHPLVLLFLNIPALSTGRAAGPISAGTLTKFLDPIRLVRPDKTGWLLE